VPRRRDHSATHSGLPAAPDRHLVGPVRPINAYGPGGQFGKGRRGGRRIVDQIRLIVAVPLVAVIAFAGLAIVTTAQGAQRTAQLKTLAQLSVQAGNVAHVLSAERAAAAGVLSGSTPTTLDLYSQQTSVTDAAVATYRTARAKISETALGSPDLMSRIDTGLDGLVDLRKQVRTAAPAMSSVAFSYRIVIADLDSYREAVARAGAPADVADHIRASAALSEAAEAIGQQQVDVLRALAPGVLTQALRQEITGTRTAFTESVVSFTDLATPEWLTWFAQASSGEDVVTAQGLQDVVGREESPTLNVDATQWTQSMSGWQSRIYSVQSRIDATVIDEVGTVRDGQLRTAVIDGAGVIAALLLAVLLTALVARRITRRLRRLHDAAQAVAYQRLPDVVAELRNAAPGTVRPEEVAERSAADVLVGGRDEISEVAQAFQAVHREAVRIAGEQAVMRSNVAEIFVHLSRREQRLVDAVLAQVDAVERDETDPDRLQQLYQLDHLATRMARINLSLLVLGGSGAARVRREDAPLVKVLQAAISQIEHYTRVRFEVVDSEVAVISDAVDEVVHLIAELVDNATGYSPPEKEVWVTGRALGDRVIVQVGDDGVGLSPIRRQQLNEMLAEPPAIDIAVVRNMGLIVVGHIAARYGIRVELRPGPETGTIAEITLPSAVFRAISAEERQLSFAAGTEALTSGSGDFTNGNGRGGKHSTAEAAPGAGLFTPPAFNVFAKPAEDLPAPDPLGDTVAMPMLNGYGPNGVQPSPAGSPPGPGAWPPHAEPTRPAVLAAAVDDTTPLPIFQEVNGWFRAESGPVNIDYATVDAEIVHEPLVSWGGAADIGWSVAEKVAEPTVSSTTPSGLPVRDPQRHLVPGSAQPTQQERRATVQAKRDPGAVAAAMSAYARGVAGRRGPNQ
jgi:signal transduction histidine kinase